MPDILASLFGFALMTAYWPDIAGVATTPRWDVAALLSVALFFAPWVRMTAAHWVGLALIGWLALSLLWNDGGQDGRLDGVEALIELGIGAIAFAVGSTLTSLRPLMVGAAIGIGVNSAVAVAQWVGWQGVETFDGGYAGLFHNRDRLAAAAALVAVGLVALPRVWLLLPLLLPSLVLAPSRGAWLAIIAGVCARPRGFHALKVLAAIAVTGALARWVIEFNPSASERVMIWRDTISHLTFFGHGLGSFRETFIGYAHHFDIAVQHSRPEHPHNEWLWIDYEGGVPALALAIVFAFAVWRAAEDRPECTVLVGLFALSLFSMPLHDPATLVLGALCAGHCAGYDARERDGSVARRMALREGIPADRDRCGDAAHGDCAEGLPVPAQVS